MFKHILFATDGSAASENAAQLAVDLARVHGARLTALFVIDYPELGMGEENSDGFKTFMADAMRSGNEAHRGVQALCGAAMPPVEFHPKLVEDTVAADGIIRAAREDGTDLVVIGSHGRTGLARLMLGSVASKVVAESPVPVLVAR
jgi:nucleotide-binding universal stress UspA family protein